MNAGIIAVNDGGSALCKKYAKIPQPTRKLPSYVANFGIVNPKKVNSSLIKRPGIVVLFNHRIELYLQKTITRLQKYLSSPLKGPTIWQHHPRS